MSQQKILLADDSVTIQKVVNLTFADEGIEVLTVGDGDAAMEKISEFKPDLVLADVNMPGLSGYQICERIKQSEDLAQTPVILLVGSFEPFDEQEAQRVGADEFLTKPFQSIRQLVSKVTELLDSDEKDTEATADEAGENIAGGAENNDSDLSPNSNRFDSAVLDDEMIQTNQPGGFAFDEVRKFETKDESEPAEAWEKTQPLSAEELKDTSSSAPEESTAKEFSETQKLSEISSFKNTEPVREPVFSHPTTALEFDDEFFLELPPAKSEKKLKKEMESPHAESPAVSEQTRHTASFAASPQLSPETVDIIVQKVIERLADKIIREIAWEVIPQMTDLIVKKMAEDNIKK